VLGQAVVAVTVSEAQVLLNSNCNDSQRSTTSTIRGVPARSDTENGNSNPLQHCDP
jgi:hypothetical protein